MSRFDTIKKLREDKIFRMLWASSVIMGWNFLYSLYNGFLALVFHSYWFFTMFVYYLTHIIKKSPIFYKLGMNGFAAYNVL